MEEEESRHGISYPKGLWRLVSIESAKDGVNQSKNITRWTRFVLDLSGILHHLIDDVGISDSHHQSTEKLCTDAIHLLHKPSLLAVVAYIVTNEPNALKETREDPVIRSYIESFIKAWQSQ